MPRPRPSVRWLIAAVAVVGFDLAAMARAVHQGRLAHDVGTYAAGFGAILLVLNLLGLGLGIAFARMDPATRWRSKPSPVVMLGLYLAVLCLAILSVLFASSGLF